MIRLSRFPQILVITFFASSWLYAEPAGPIQLSPEQAVARALEGNKDLAAARTVIEQARARRANTGRLDNPELNVSYATDTFFGNEGEASFSLGFEQRFPLTKRLSLLKGIADVEIAIAETEVSERERQLAKEVGLHCNELEYYAAELALRNSLVEVDKRFLAFLESRIEAAEASPIDANQLRIELYALEQDMHQIEIERSACLGRLGPLLGFEVGTRFTVETSTSKTEALEELPVFAQGDLDTHPIYRLKQLLLEVADKQISVARASRWEDVAVGLVFDEERSVDEPMGIGNNQFLGVSVSVPLPLRKGSRGLELERLQYRKQASEELEAISLALRSEAETLRGKVMSLYRQATHYETNVTQLVDQNLKEMNEAYGSGQISLSDLFRSQSQSLRIQSAHLAMVRDYKRALVEWKAATARNLEIR